jgi:hypothetical protein
MLTFLHRFLRGESPLSSRHVRLRLQSLEDRCTPASDVVAQSLSWNTAAGGATAGYTIVGDHLSVDTTAALYWADGPTLADKIGSPVKQFVILRTSSNSGSVSIPRAALGIRPIRASYLLLDVDSSNRVVESDESNNVQALAVPDVIMDSVTTADSRGITVTYEVTGLALGSVSMSLVRSTDARFDSGDQSIAPIVNLDGGVGTHTVTVALATPLAINPSRPFVIAQLDPSNTIVESNEINNTGSFRTRVLGVVTHGFELFGGLRFAFPTWITDVANDLRAEGYDRAFAFDWTALSNIPAAGMTGLAAAAMTARIDTEIASMKAQWPNDVIDVHLIGHSRGASVISQAAEMLADNPDVIRGTLRLTFLDPHPASNVPGRHDYDSAFLVGFPFEQAYLGFQALAQDPDPVVAADVDIADQLYQHTPTWMARAGSGERVLNLWGNIPIVDLSPYAIHTRDLTGWGMSHGGVITWFMQYMLPQLGRGLA